MKSLNDISQEIGKWAKRNFKNVTVSEIGALEEIGEAAHCIIKHAQGIRGFDKEDFFIDQLADALGDIGVYVLHFCFNAKIAPPAEYGLLDDGVRTEKDILGLMARSVSVLLTSEDENLVINNVARLLAATSALGQMHGIDAEKALRDTWDKVSQRDWQKNPENADAVQQSESKLPPPPESPASKLRRAPVQTPTQDLLDELKDGVDTLERRIAIENELGKRKVALPNAAPASQSGAEETQNGGPEGSTRTGDEHGPAGEKGVPGVSGPESDKGV